MAKVIKDLLKDLTDRFKDVSTTNTTQLENMKKVAEAAKQAALEAKK